MPRADKLYKIQKHELKEDYILILLIDREKGFALSKDTSVLNKEKKFNNNWNKLSLDIIKTVIKVAKKISKRKIYF